MEDIFESEQLLVQHCWYCSVFSAISLLIHHHVCLKTNQLNWCLVLCHTMARSYPDFKPTYRFLVKNYWNYKWRNNLRIRKCSDFSRISQFQQVLGLVCGCQTSGMKFYADNMHLFSFPFLYLFDPKYKISNQQIYFQSILIARCQCNYVGSIRTQVGLYHSLVKLLLFLCL